MIRILTAALALLLATPAAAAPTPPAPAKPTKPPKLLYWQNFEGNTLPKDWRNGAERFSGYPHEEVRFSNGEQQQYVPSQATVENGLLILRARPMTAAEKPAWAKRVADPWFKYSGASQAAMLNVGWVSGQVSTWPNAYFVPGSILTVKLKQAVGKGAWGAAWAFDYVNVTEIDLYEGNGAASTDPKGNSSHAVHDFPGNYHNGCNIKFKMPTGKWLLYSADWTDRTRVRYSVDGVEMCSVPTSPRMTKPMSIILNLAMGSSSPWHEKPDPKAPPTPLVVDWLKVEMP